MTRESKCNLLFITNEWNNWMKAWVVCMSVANNYYVINVIYKTYVYNPLTLRWTYKIDGAPVGTQHLGWSNWITELAIYVPFRAVNSIKLIWR
jgi:hypothetical protein